MFTENRANINFQLIIFVSMKGGKTSEKPFTQKFFYSGLYKKYSIIMYPRMVFKRKIPGKRLTKINNF